jgi:tetratricopeptide (TPR) repeat protein
VTSLEHTTKRLKGLIVKRPGMAIGLWGEAGIGKTHTTQNLLRETQCQHLSQHATSSVSSIAHALPKPKKLLTWVQTIFDKLGRNEYLSVEQTSSAFGAVLSENAPFILHLEDIHEANTEQLEWIVALANVVTHLKGVALLVTSRNAPPEPFESIRLEVLGFEAAKVLLEQEARAPLPPEALEWIHGRAAGNPLFTVEFFKFLARLGFIWNDGQQWRWHTPEQDMMPATVEALIEQMLNQAVSSQVLTNVLAAKTMLPRDTDFDLWARVVGISRDALNDAITELSKRGILINHEFAHPLFGEVSAQKVPLEKRQDLARKALHSLEDNPLLAISFVQDAALSELESRQWIERGINQAVSNNNLALACDLKIQALEWYEPDAQQQLGLEVAKEVRFYNLPKAATLFERFKPQTPDDIYVHAEVLARVGQLTDAKQVLENMPETFKTNLVWLEHLVMIHNDAEDHVGAVAQWDEQTQPLDPKDAPHGHGSLLDPKDAPHGHGSLLDPKDAPHGHGSLHSSSNPKFLYKVAQSLTALSRFKDAETILEFALHQTPSEALRANIYLSKGILGDFVSDRKSSEKHYQAAREIYQRNGDSYNLGCVFYRLGAMEYYQDSLSAAVSYLEQSIKFFTEVGHQAQRLQSLTLLAATRIELNQCQTAERELLEAEEQLRGTTFRSKWIMTCTNLSFLYRGWDIPYGAVLALKYARTALQGATEINNPRLIANCLYHVSKSETFSNNPAEGLRLADQCLALAGQLEYPAMLAYPHHARYQALLALNRFDEALAALQIAETKNRILGHNHDANFYALEYQCLTKNWETAREMLTTIRNKESFFYAQIATRHFPELEQASTVKPSPELRLKTFGTMQISGAPIRGRKRQELLILLLEARITGKPQLEKLELLEALYPTEPEDRAASSLKELIRGTRTSFGKEIIQTTVGGYALGQMTSDLEEFLKNGDTQLWQGMYLQNLEFENSESIRDLLEQALYNRMLQLLETDVKEASRVSRFLLAMNSYDLEMLRISLYALRAARNYKTLERVYENAKVYLLEVGETLPENWSDFLTKSLEAAYPPQNLTAI